MKSGKNDEESVSCESGHLAGHHLDLLQPVEEVWPVGGEGQSAASGAAEKQRGRWEPSALTAICVLARFVSASATATTNKLTSPPFSGAKQPHTNKQATDNIHTHPKHTQ